MFEGFSDSVLLLILVITKYTHFSDIVETLLLKPTTVTVLVHCSALVVQSLCRTRNRMGVASESGKGDESESGQMVLEKMKWVYFNAYL